jgi:hypothetical protein
MIRKAVFALAVVIAHSDPSSAQLPQPTPAQFPLPIPLPMLEGTPEDRAACESDVRRYCQTAIPDNMRVLACLQQFRARISPACRGVLEKYGQ